MWLSRDIFVRIPAGVSYSPSTSNSRTCCGNRATIVGPSARTSMNLNRAILPCPLDFPVAIASVRCNNIHLTICRSVLPRVRVCVAYPVCPTRRGSFPLRISFGASCSSYYWRSPNPGEFRKTEHTFVDRAAHIYAQLISHGDTTSRNSWEFSANRHGSQRYAIVRNAPGTRCRNGIFVLFSLLFFSFFSIETRFDQVLY